MVSVDRRVSPPRRQGRWDRLQRRPLPPVRGAEVQIPAVEPQRTLRRHVRWGALRPCYRRGVMPQVRAAAHRESIDVVALCRLFQIPLPGVGLLFRQTGALQYAVLTGAGHIVHLDEDVKEGILLDVPQLSGALHLLAVPVPFVSERAIVPDDPVSFAVVGIRRHADLFGDDGAVVDLPVALFFNVDLHRLQPFIPGVEHDIPRLDIAQLLVDRDLLPLLCQQPGELGGALDRLYIISCRGINSQSGRKGERIERLYSVSFRFHIDYNRLTHSTTLYRDSLFLAFLLYSGYN